jgi:hypothetical protein
MRRQEDTATSRFAQSPPADAIHRTTAIHRCSDGADAGGRHSARPVAAAAPRQLERRSRLDSRRLGSIRRRPPVPYLQPRSQNPERTERLARWQATGLIQIRGASLLRRAPTWATSASPALRRRPPTASSAIPQRSRPSTSQTTAHRSSRSSARADASAPPASRRRSRASCN